MKRYTLLLAALAASPLPSAARGQTALDTYVAAPDAYSSVGLGTTYSLANTVPGSGYTGYVLDMTSQVWRTTADVNRTDWQHWLTVITPDVVTSDRALLFITGGSNGGGAPNGVDGTLAQYATATGSVVAELRTVPNQPLFFTDEVPPNGRYEDEIIAYTFDKYLNDPTDDTWPLLAPMVKSAVRAMDTVQDYVPQVAAGADVAKFVVSGVSKRGWTTWLTAANDAAAAPEDRRVEAIMPVVIDVLNIDEQMNHHRRAYENLTQNMVGGYSDAIQDYVAMNVIDRLDTPVGQDLLEIVDPYEYRDRLTLPKYALNSTGDEFFLPDSAQFYFGDLPGQNYLRYVPNTNHGIFNGSDAAESMQAYYAAIVRDGGASLPRFSWTVQDDGSIEVDAVDGPAAVNLWQATNPTTRDFQKRHIGSAWTSSPLADQGGGRYVGQVSDPGGTGWTAFFVEMVYDSGGPYPYKFTTEVSVSSVERHWTDPAGGALSDGDNWAKLLPLFPRDTAIFDLAGSYQVTLPENETTRRLVVANDQVTLALAGSTYAATSTASADPSIVVGRDSGDVGLLTITGGTLSGVEIAIAKSTGSVGIVLVDAGGVLAAAGTLHVGGVQTGAGGAGFLTVGTGGEVDVTGTLKVWSGGTLELIGGQTSAGQLQLDGGTLRGAGAVAANVLNSGLVTPGNSPGLVSVAGDYSQTAAGTLAIDVGGLAGGSDSDLLAVTGTATLAGTLELRLAGGFVPVLGNALTIVTADTASGAFGTLDATAAPLGLGPTGLPLEWLVDYEHPGQVELLVGVRGDMDLDGDVDFDDIGPLVQGLNDPGGYLAARGHGASAVGDLDGDWDLDFDDITGFVARLGGGAPQAVPEPAALALALLAFCGLRLAGYRAFTG